MQLNNWWCSIKTAYLFRCAAHIKEQRLLIQPFQQAEVFCFLSTFRRDGPPLMCRCGISETKVKYCQDSKTPQFYPWSKFSMCERNLHLQSSNVFGPLLHFLALISPLKLLLDPVKKVFSGRHKNTCKCKSEPKSAKVHPFPRLSQTFASSATNCFGDMLNWQYASPT